MTNTQRLDVSTVAPDALRAVLGLSKVVLESGSLDEKLLTLCLLRASQMNRCAFCVVLHANDARDEGESEDRLTAVAVWRDTPWFTKRERLALEWPERLTDLVHSEIDDDLYARARAEFGERGLVDLSLAIGTSNVYNRLNVPFRVPPNPAFRTRMALAAVR